jgi:hypothetical protein
MAMKTPQITAKAQPAVNHYPARIFRLGFSQQYAGNNSIAEQK